MTVNDPRSDTELDFESAKRVLSRANAFVLANLPQFADVSRLREGDFDEDYFLEVPAHRRHDIGELITPLEYLALMRFDVGLGVMPVPSRDTGTTL